MDELKNTEKWLTNVFIEGFSYGLENYGSDYESIEDEEVKELAEKAFKLSQELSVLEAQIEDRAEELGIDTEF